MVDEKCTHRSKKQRDVYKDLKQRKKTHAIAKAPHNVILTNIYTYIHICCRKGIWSPGGGDLVPKTLPTAEPSILARGIQEKIAGLNGSVLRDQIPRVRGPNPLLSRPSRKRPRKQSPKVLRNHYFYSGFVNFRAFLSGNPKNKKQHHAENVTIWGPFRGAQFCTFSPFWFFSNFYLAPLAHSHLRTVLKPLFL